MEEISIRELRIHASAIVDRVIGGEKLTVTRHGRPVARLVPAARDPLSASELAQRWSRLPPMNLELLRQDLDAIVDSSL